MSFARRDERGQAIVLMTLSLVVMMGMATLVLDVGNWYHTKRRLQGTADAAALAGAQLLPTDSSGAQSQALAYANKNGGDVAGGNIAVTSTVLPNDTISVRARKTDPGIFSGILGIASADIDARAKARVGPPTKARYVAPMVVDCAHPLIHNCDGDSTPDFGVTTTMDYDPMGAPGAYGMLNLGGVQNPGSSEEADWILHGFDQYLGLGNYRSDPGSKFPATFRTRSRPARALSCSFLCSGCSAARGRTPSTRSSAGSAFTSPASTCTGTTRCCTAISRNSSRRESWPRPAAASLDPQVPSA
jgi:hypothetical protein